MSWAAVAGAAVGVVGGAISSGASNRAAGRQTDSGLAAIDEQRRQYDQTREDQAPYRDAGVKALGTLGSLADQYNTPFQYQNDPGYQFGLTEGTNALESSAAARGGLYSGNALKALQRYGTDYATTKYNDAFNRNQTTQNSNWNRYAGLAGIGQTAQGQVQQAGQNYSNNVSNLLTGIGNVNAGNSLAQGNIWGNALNQGVSAWNRRTTQTTSNPYTAMPTYGTDYGE